MSFTRQFQVLGSTVQASAAMEDWRIPAWDVDAKSSSTQLHSKLAALAAPLPAPNTVPSNNPSLQLKVDATNGCAPLTPREPPDAPNFADRDTGDHADSVTAALTVHCFTILQEWDY